MSAANKNNITQREGLGRPLTRGEMDDNFEELKNVIDDINAHTGAEDPHPQYVTSQDITDGINAHINAEDPHPQYVTTQDIALIDGGTY